MPKTQLSRAELEDLFYQMSLRYVPKMVEAGVGVGLPVQCCLDIIDKVVEDLRRKISENPQR